MDVSDGTCFTAASLKPNPSQLRYIRNCQQLAQTPYCYPPHGTRICVPSGDIPFYWPTTYYNADALISLEWQSDPDPAIIFISNNTGNNTDYFVPHQYDTAARIPGVPGERRLPIYFVERLVSQPDSEVLNTDVHDGPELILVKTAEFSTSTRSSRTSATATPWPTFGSSSGDHRKRNAPDGMKAAVIIIAIVVGVMFMLCCYCCCGRKKKDPNADRGIPQTDENQVWLSRVRRGYERSEGERGEGEGGPSFVLFAPGGRGNGVVLEPDGTVLRDEEPEREHVADEEIDVPPPAYTPDDVNNPPKYTP